MTSQFGRSWWTRPSFWFLAPAVIWTLSFAIYPLVYSLVLSFQNVRLGRETTFVGLENYGRMWTDYQFWSAVRFTLIFVIVTVAVQLIFGMVLALAANHELRARSFVRMVLILPLFATPVGIGFLGIIMFMETRGPINQFLMLFQPLVDALGVSFDMNIPWRSDPLWAGVAVALLDIWQWTPFCFLILLAGLQSIPEELYESMRLDTSSGWDLFANITLPLMRPIIGIVILLRMVEAFKIIDIPFAFTKGGPGIATQTYTMYVWRSAFTAFELGYASALGYVFLIFILVVVNLLIWFGGLRGAVGGEE